MGFPLQGGGGVMGGGGGGRCGGGGGSVEGGGGGAELEITAGHRQFSDQNGKPRDQVPICLDMNPIDFYCVLSPNT